MVDYKKRGESRFWTTLWLIALSAVPANADWYMVTAGEGAMASVPVAYESEELCVAAGRFAAERGYKDGSDWIIHVFYSCVPDNKTIKELIVQEHATKDGVPIRQNNGN